LDDFSPPANSSLKNRKEGILENKSLNNST